MSTYIFVVECGSISSSFSSFSSSSSEFQEPTSGQDSKTAEDIVDLLSWLADQGRTLIVNIHAPSWRNFERFGNVVLLAKGKMMFSGPTEQIEGYFEGLGFLTPKGVNPMDHILRVVQTEQSLLPMQTPSRMDTMATTVSSLPDVGMVPSPKQADMFGQFWVLLQRFFLDAFKDKEKAVAGMGLKLTTGILVGIVWLRQAGEKTNGKADECTCTFLISFSSQIFRHQPKHYLSCHK